MYNLPYDAFHVLRSVRRALAGAKSLRMSDPTDRRRALVLSNEVQGHIRSLTERLQYIENEMQSVNRSIVAVNAYSKCAKANRSNAWARIKRAEP